MMNILNDINQIIEKFSSVIFSIIAIILMLFFVVVGICPYNIRKLNKGTIVSILNSFIKALGKPAQGVINIKNIYLKVLCIISIFLVVCYIFYASYLVNVTKTTLFNFRLVFLAVISALLSLVILYIFVTVLIILQNRIISFIMDYIESIRKTVGNLALASLVIPIMSVVALKFGFKFDNKALFYFILVVLVFGTFFIYKGLFLIISKPEYLSAKNYKFNKHSKYVGMIVWLILLVFNLYCAVLVISYIDKNAFITDGKPVSSLLGLFYFTVYSLITIGFGGVSPNGYLGKSMEIILFISGVYYLVVFIGAVLTARVSDKEELYGFINRRVNIIVSNLSLLLSNLEKETKIDISRNEVSENVVHKVLNKINPNSKSPLAIGYKEEYVAWIQYLLISKEQCIDNIKSIYNLITLLEPDFIKILLRIEDSLYFRHLEKVNNQDIRRTNNLSFLTKEFTDYIEIINELEQYRKDNLEEYKIEKNL